MDRNQAAVRRLGPPAAHSSQTTGLPQELVDVVIRDFICDTPTSGYALIVRHCFTTSTNLRRK